MSQEIQNIPVELFCHACALLPHLLPVFNHGFGEIRDVTGFFTSIWMEIMRQAAAAGEKTSLLEMFLCQRQKHRDYGVNFHGRERVDATPQGPGRSEGRCLTPSPPRVAPGTSSASVSHHQLLSPAPAPRQARDVTGDLTRPPSTLTRDITH